MTLGKLRRVDRQLPVEHQVVAQCQGLAHHHQADDRQQAPEHDRVEPGRANFFDAGDQPRSQDRQIREQKTRTAHRTLRLGRQRRRRGRTQRSDGDQ